MPIDLKLAERFPLPRRGRPGEAGDRVEDGPPTQPSPLPKFEEIEDDVLPELDEEPPRPEPEVRTADTVKLDLKTLNPRAHVRPHHTGWERLRKNAVLQLGVMSGFGVIVVLVVFSWNGPSAEPAAPEASTEKFPTIEIKGAPLVTPGEIERRMRSGPQIAIEGDAPADRVDQASRDEIIRTELKAIAELGRAAALEDQDGTPAKRSSVRQKIAEAHSPPPAKPKGRWFSPGGMVKVEGAPSKDAEKKLPLGVGDRLSAKLEVGISTSHAAPVLARLSEEVRVEGRLVAPAGAIAKGRFQSDAHRVFVTFSELILPTGERLHFEGYAVERKIPGLIATRIENEDGDGGAVVREGFDVAKEVARSVASGSIVGRVAQGVVDGATSEAQSDASPGAAFVLEVPAGKSFQIVVTEGAER